MEFGILGPLTVHTATGSIELSRATARTLLVALLIKAPEPTPATALADMLWGDRQPQNPSNALQLQISYLRKALASSEGPAPIVTRGNGYSVELE